MFLNSSWLNNICVKFSSNSEDPSFLRGFFDPNEHFTHFEPKNKHASAQNIKIYSISKAMVKLCVQNIQPNRITFKKHAFTDTLGRKW